VGDDAPAVDLFLVDPAAAVERLGDERCEYRDDVRCRPNTGTIVPCGSSLWRGKGEAEVHGKEPMGRCAFGQCAASGRLTGFVTAVLSAVRMTRDGARRLS
jgi:hypothetical protein